MFVPNFYPYREIYLLRKIDFEDEYFDREIIKIFTENVINNDSKRNWAKERPSCLL